MMLLLKRGSSFCGGFPRSPSSLQGKMPSMAVISSRCFASKEQKKSENIASGQPDVHHFRAAKDPSMLPPKDIPNVSATGEAKILPYNSWLPHPIWSDDQTSSVKITHTAPTTKTDKAAYYAVQSLRSLWDFVTGYGTPSFNAQGWINRVTYLETVAGVPGMVGAMVRHLNSLRRLERDFGWIHTLLEEAENERMHLMTALVLKKPGPIFRWMVLLGQGVFITFFGFSYLLSPRFCHRFVGYLEEEAVKTYTKLLEEMDKGLLPELDVVAPQVAIHYWQLPQNARLRDVILAVRADEAHHREVNHTFAGLKLDDPNPFPPGY